MAAPALTDAKIGQVLAKKYRLDALLGEGGVGRVYRAQNLLIGRTVAVKLLKPELIADEHLISRFMREARTANRVRHAHIVDVMDVGVDDSGTPYIIQELLQGEALSSYMVKQGGRLPIGNVIAIMLPVIDAVGYAHSKGVVHRDLKPENIFLVREGQHFTPKVVDFGISKVLQADEKIRVTTAGVSLGTPAYMSPEQIQHFAEIDARTDIWALGTVLYELIAGRLPYVNDVQSALFVQICTTDPQSLDAVAPHTPPDLVSTVMRCLRHSPSERYATADELGQDLRRVMDEHNIEPSAQVMMAIRGPRTSDRVRPLPTGHNSKLPPAVAVAVAVASDPDSVESVRNARSGRHSQVPQTVTNNAGLEQTARDIRSGRHSQVPRTALPGSHTEDPIADTLITSIPSGNTAPVEPPANVIRTRSSIGLMFLGAVLAGTLGGLFVASKQQPATVVPRPTVSPFEIATPTTVPAQTPQPPQASISPAQPTVATATPVPAVTPTTESQSESAAPAKRGPRAEGTTAYPRPHRDLTARPPRARPRAHEIASPTTQDNPEAEVQPPSAATPTPSPADGYLTLDTTPWTTVSMGGQILGTTPLVHVRLSAGRHELTLRNPERNLTTTYIVNIREGETTARSLGLE